MTAVTDQDHTDNDHTDHDHTDHDQTDSGRIDNDQKDSKSSKDGKDGSSGRVENPDVGEQVQVQEQVRAQDRVGAEDAGTGPHAPSRREPGSEPGTELGTDPGADAGAEPGTDSAGAWDDGLIARRVSEASAAELAAVMEPRVGGGGGSTLPSTPLTYDAPCGPGSTRCVNSWGSPAPGSTAGPSPRPAGCSTRRRPGAGSPVSTPSSPSRAPPGAASRSCSTPSPE